MSKSESLLWQVKFDNKDVGYIFGSMHAKDKRAYTFIDQVQTHIDECQTYFAESDIEELHAISSQMMQIQSDSLIEMIGKRKYLRLNKVLKKRLDFNLDLFVYLHPFVILNVLSELMLDKDHIHPFDMQLWMYAKEKGIPCRGLESAAEQMAIFKKIPIETSLKALIKAGSNLKKFRKELIKIATLYQQAELNKLYKKTKKQLGNLRKLLLYDRNLVMARRLEMQFQKEKTFVTIGAAHLSGEKGVLRLIKLQGFTIRPVN